MQRRSRLFVLAITLATFAAFAVTPTSRAVAQDDQGGSVVGTWTGSFSLTGTPFSFTELGSINLGGTMVGVNGISHFCDNPLVPPALVVDASGYFGSWAQIGNSDEIALTFKRLLFACPETPPSLYGKFFNGQNIGLATIQALLALQHTRSGDILSGPFTFQFTNFKELTGLPSDQVVFTGSGTVSLSRVAIEPLSAP
jgi:hypothetical protein